MHARALGPNTCLQRCCLDPSVSCLSYSVKYSEHLCVMHMWKSEGLSCGLGVTNTHSYDVVS